VRSSFELCVRTVSDASRNSGPTGSLTGTLRCRSLLREVVGGECVGAFRCALLSAAGSISTRAASVHPSTTVRHTHNASEAAAFRSRHVDRLLVDRPKCKWCTRRSTMLLSEEGDGQRNRRLALFSFRFLNGLSEKRAKCAQECAQTSVPNMRSKRTIESARAVALSVKGGGLNAFSFTPCAIERFRVSACVRYTCRRAVRWPRG
jgi:hypothetical protein